MSEILEIFTGSSESTLPIIITALLSLIITLFSVSINRKASKIRSETSKDLIDIMQNEEQKQAEIVVNEAIVSVPEGMSSDEYFAKLKDILSEVSFSNLKNSNENSDDNNIEMLIRNHHEQALSQASVQFWFSLVASIIGFIFIIAMIALSNNAQWYEYILKTLPGAIVEVISLLFFSQAKETRARATEFLNKLREDRQFKKSIIVADSIDDEKLRAIVKAKIALHMSGLSEASISFDIFNQLGSSS